MNASVTGLPSSKSAKPVPVHPFRVSPYQHSTNPLPKPSFRPPPKSLQLGFHPNSSQNHSAVNAQILNLPPQPIPRPIAPKAIALNPNPVSKIVTQHDRHIKNRSHAFLLWNQLIQWLTPFSIILQQIAQSSFSRAIHERILAPFADSTIQKYAFLCLTFFQAVADLGYDIESLTSTQFADVLLSLQWSDDDPTMTDTTKSMAHYVKAIRWLQKLTQITLPDLYQPPISSFCFGDAPHKESIPFSLFLLTQWERDIIFATEDLSSLLFKGAVLICAWASLRFSDASHIQWSSLVLDPHALRGISWRTKTSKKGMPFGVFPFGFLNDMLVDLSSTWLYRYLILLDRVWFATKTIHHPSVNPDSLFMSLDSNDSFSSPMTYCQALRMLRRCIQSTMFGFSWELLRNFTMHSAKSTMLSWAAQCSQNPESRAVQGHHKTQAGMSSVRLYSRDDVFPALALQQEVARRIRTGWRPCTPQHRGSQTPALDPPVSLAAHLPKNLASHDWTCVSVHLMTGPTVAEACNFDPDLQLRDNSSDKAAAVNLNRIVPPPEAPAAQPIPPKPTSYGPKILFILGPRIAHVATPADYGPTWNHRQYRPRCGALCGADSEVQKDIPATHRLCLRRACANTFSHYDE